MIKQTEKETLFHLVTTMERATDDETDTDIENDMGLVIYISHETDMNSEIDVYYYFF